jgi:hypothetical protein
VVLNFRRFISAFLALVVLASGLPYLTCSAAVCAANADCASVHCSCCGPNCPWAKNSQESQKKKSNCAQQCPLITASKSVTISNTRPLAAAMLGVGEVQPFLFAHNVADARPVRQFSALHPPTLLSLACALTI